MADFDSYKAATDKKIASLEDQVQQLLARLEAVESGSSRPSTAASKRPTTATKTGTLTKTNGASAASIKKSPSTGSTNGSTASAKKGPPANLGKKPEIIGPEIDPARIGFYQVGKRKVYYVTPSDYKEEGSKDQPPREELNLTWVYGYRGEEGNNMFFANENGSTVIYNMAATGVVYDPEAHTQKFFKGHNEDILSLAVSKTARLCATGQIDPKGRGKPYTCVWNYDTMELVRKQEGFHDRGICALGFTGDGKKLVSVGNDDSHTAGVWNLDDAKAPYTSIMTAKDEIYGVAVNPHNEEVEFVAYGNKTIKHIVIGKDEKGKPNPKGTMLGKHTGQGACWMSNGDLVVGTADGTIFVYRGKDGKLAEFKSIKAHTGGVGSVAAFAGGFVSGGDDGAVLVFDADYNQTKKIELGKLKVRAIDVAGDLVNVGTASNSIIQVNIGNGSHNVVMHGHHGEVWGAAVHPTEHTFITAGHDKVVRAWNYDTNEPVPGKSKVLRNKIGSVAISPDGRTIACGLHPDDTKKKENTAHVVLLDYDTFEVKYEKAHRKEQIDAIAFSPNGQLLAVGSWDQCAELIDLESKSSVVLKGHTSSITHLSFSADSKYLITNSRDYETLFWDTESGKRVDKNITADSKWHDWTCILGWPCKGLFGKGQDGTDVNAAHIAPSNRLMASGNDTGEVSLYRVPSSDKGKKQYQSHSAFVTNVRFSNDEKWLFSTGGNDKAIMQWAIQ